MTDRIYFTDEFDGRHIDFEFPHNSSWTLLEKVKEKHILADKEEFDTMGARPCAWALFVCQNVNEPSRRALMKVYMQIPYTGSEFQRARQRKTQASATPNERVRNEASALSRLHEAGCQHVPELIGYRNSDTQDDDDLVPGGYIVYLATTLVPGISLGPQVMGNNQYWQFSADIRESIREAFKIAYLYVTLSEHLLQIHLAANETKQEYSERWS